ncbi:hypothetical protein [Nonomuraea ceibae]|uniref:hypothetical protein n=1 Tax=Nonomuraea ceibae TaxID=1935170 RepID=UPI001C5F9030|nr:hypothetical protein [Nonomuraea ceibae]
MHPDIHLRLDRIRAAELRADARRWRRARHHRPARTAWAGALGWAMIEAGLRLVQHSATRRAAVTDISGDLI